MPDFAAWLSLNQMIFQRFTQRIFSNISQPYNDISTARWYFQIFVSHELELNGLPIYPATSEQLQLQQTIFKQFLNASEMG